ncbi:MAG TPA: cache domain-containing protein [Alphaproteobacteria bacterium]|nr:cache domain-containing protein [Alphaproteobacteria bacterium]
MSPQESSAAGAPPPFEPPDRWGEADPWISRTPSRLLIWFGIVLIAASMAAAALVLWEMRSDALDKAQIDLRRLALSQSQQTLAAFKGADLAVLSIINDLASNPGSDDETRHRMLQSIVPTLPQLKNLFVTDAQGNALYSARSFPPPRVSAVEQPYFVAHQAGQMGPLVTPSFRSRVDGQWVFLLTRRMEDANGRFLGVVGADIDPVYLSRLYAAIDLGPHSAIALLTTDEVMLARYPWIEGRVGRAVENFNLHQLLTQDKIGSTRGISGSDHIDRLYGYAALDDYPVVVRTVLDTSVVLDEWWRHASVAGIWVIGADIVIAALIALLVLQLRRRERSEARFRDFAEAASDWYWETDGDLRFSYVSRAGHGHTGFPVHDALGRSLRDLMITQPGDLTVGQLEDDIAAQRLFREFLCQVRTPAGRIAHLNLSGMPRFDARGNFVGYRGVARDITAVVEERSASSRANMRFLYAMEHGANGFSFWDAEDRFVVCNELYRRSSGRAAKFLVPGVTFERFYWESIRLGDVPSPPGRAAEILAERLARHRAAAGEPVIHDVNGRRLLARDLRTPDGGTLIVWADITDAAEGARPVEVKGPRAL